MSHAERLENSKGIKHPFTSKIYQFIQYSGVAGIGWVINFFIYCFLVYLFSVPVFWSNIFSAIPPVTLVFFLSTKKVFLEKKSKIPLFLKYVLFGFYTTILLVIVSMVGEYLYQLIMHTEQLAFLHAYTAIFVKCCITGITMICNFLILKGLIEKI